MSRFLLTLAVLFFASMPAVAQSVFPVKPVTLIVPFPAGGGLDIVARLLAKEMSISLGQSVVVDNRPGAGGTIGSATVARALPDGYTLLFGSIATHAIAPAVYPKLTYNALKDFSPITQVSTTSLVLASSARLPVNSVGQLIALAKSKPGVLNYASTGKGTSDHLAGALFAGASNIDVVHIPYKGGAEANLALVSGESSFFIANAQAVIAQIKAGNLKALAVTGPRKLAAFPEAPTLAEAGVPGVEITTWFGLFAPANTPTDVVNRLNRDAQLALKNLRDSLVAQGVEPAPSTPAQFTEFLSQEHRKWDKVVRDANIKLE